MDSSTDIQSTDLLGKKFGKLTATEKTKKYRHGQLVWKCLCDCGNEKEVNTAHLQSGKVKSCGCARHSNLVGQTFGKLIVTEMTNKRKNGYIVWKCLCTCGNEKEAITSDLKRGNVKSCGCAKRSNLLGQTFGKLTVIEKTNKPINGHVVWRCLCSCGNEKEVSTGSLKNGNVKSCGCAKRNNLLG